MAKSSSPKQVSETLAGTLLNREVELFYGLANGLAQLGVPIMNQSGKPNKFMLIREALRIAAEVVGQETGNKKLVETAKQFKEAFRRVRVPDNSWRSRARR
jgi:hypothetical protein